MIRYVIRILQWACILIPIFGIRWVFVEHPEWSSDAQGFAGVGFIFLAMFAVAWIGNFYPKNIAEYWNDGKVGIGRVKTYTRSGLKNGVRNYDVDVDVIGEDGEAFSGRLSVPVGRRRLAALHEGLWLPVIYRAKKPQKLFVPHGPLLTRAQLFYDYMNLQQGRLDNETLQAGYFGLPARAVVTDASFGGLEVPGKARVDLSLDVFTPDGHQFPSTATLLADKYEAELLKEARYLEVKYLPHSPGKVAVKIPKRPKSR